MPGVPLNIVVARVAALLVASAGVLTGCATTTRPCAPGEQAAIHDQLYFGTTRGTGPVTADEWASFVAQVVTTNLPDGFTVWDATGQWRDARGATVTESTHVLSVAHADDADSERRVRDIAAAYRARFEQHGVYRIRTMVCSSDLRATP